MIQVVVVDCKFVKDSNLVKSLREYGFDATSVNDFVHLVIQLLNRRIDVIIFDMELFGLEAVLSVKQIRSVKNLQSLGIIILTCHCDPAQRLELVSNGADVFLSKPVQMEELSAYIKNIHERINSREVNTRANQWYFLRSEWRLIAPSGSSLALSHLEFSLMEMLVKSVGKPVRRRDIIAAGFGLDPLSYDNRRLDSIVSRLRRKIHAAYPLSQPIRVVHSVGYVFVEPIRTD
ncbi:response regulator transcription factor|uniref:response regulator transcription factor n=1 Tax=Noviherbaspirillum sp. L7-7A TaxID=2850560 RepID=UPI001C2C6A82|nr:response regulator transcription factor [Noviherbaspirillum sp. L7-7A]MBV0878961.1 response regulator transcription factor [Noviherbaspirillum sp. L7-7A]